MTKAGLATVRGLRATAERARPSVAADVAVFGLHGGLELLLVRRARAPFAGSWALPGGFCEPSESVEQAARRELREETGADGLPLEQLRTFSAPGRDPRGWVISIAHLATIPADRMHLVRAGDDASEASWFRVVSNSRGLRLERDGKPCGPLAFDHDEIARDALARLRAEVDRLAITLLPRRFTLADAHAAFEQVLDQRLDKSSFRKRLLSLHAVRGTSAFKTGKHRPAQLYVATRPHAGSQASGRST